MNDLVLVHQNILSYQYSNNRGFDAMSLYRFIEGVFETKPNDINIRDLHIVANFIDYMGYYD